MKGALITSDLVRLLQAFFCQRLIQQRNVSHQTVCSYRDTFRLFLRFAEQQLGKSAAKMDLVDINASLVLAFLDDLESQRHNCIRSRNARLAAIRSFMHYSALLKPEALAVIQQVLAIPLKRFDRPLVKYLTQMEMQAILEAPDLLSWSGQRDQVLLATLYNSGGRVSEIIELRRANFDKNSWQAVCLHGKGRKKRVIPLWKRTTNLLKTWSAKIGLDPQQPIFPNRFGNMMSRSGVESRLRLAVSKASVQYPSLKDKVVSPHVIRHTTAMHLLQAGVDLSVIALWLGHESVATTHQYFEADLNMKEEALAKLQPPDMKFSRYKPSNDVLSFLNGL
ncbi:site-specific integrase [Desulfotignum balticum]|uniref:site-specific integrase n=1 Tax=Desulfotignum balticum TaxID=115781 RepID=UPI00041530BF|nr:site-specific integrase [Desulfotignum balticum]